MTDAHFTTLTTLAATFLGSLGGIVVGFLNYRHSLALMKSQERRDLMRLGLDLGLKEWEFHMGFTKEHGGQAVPPGPYADFAARFVALAVDGKLTPESYRKISLENSDLMDAVRQESARRQGKPS